MRIQPICKFIFLLAIGVFLGLGIAKTSIFSLINLLILMIVGVGVVIYLFLLLSDRLFDNKENKFTRFIGYTIVTLIIALIMVGLKIQVISHQQQKLAENIIENLETYKKVNSTYPFSLSQLNQSISIDNTKFSYWADSTQSHFTLRYAIDGWHFKVYNRKNSKWIVGD